MEPNYTPSEKGGKGDCPIYYSLGLIIDVLELIPYAENRKGLIR